MGVTTLLRVPPRIFAHRGFSSRQPESTVAAYREAIDWARAEGVSLGLECDVHFTADDHLVCLHDQFVDRTSDRSGLVSHHPLAELRQMDFGSWKVSDPSPEQRSLLTLAELLVMVAEARADGVDVTLAIETKHPNGRGLEIERQVGRMLAERGWDHADAPVRVITFSPPAAELLVRLLPDVERTLLIASDLGPYAGGVLPDGITVVGVDVTLLKQDPGFVARAQRHGNEVHVWTVNEAADIEFCRDLGVTGFTTDHPDRAHEVLSTDVSDGWSRVGVLATPAPATATAA